MICYNNYITKSLIYQAESAELKKTFTESDIMELRNIAAKYIGKTRAELGLKCEETCAEFVSKVLKEAGYKEGKSKRIPHR